MAAVVSFCSKPPMRIDRGKRIIVEKVTFENSISDPLFNEVVSTDAYIQDDL
jgi:hypothetical protein